MAFRHRLQARIALGSTVDEIAGYAVVTEATVRNWLADKKGEPPAKAELIVHALDIGLLARHYMPSEIRLTEENMMLREYVTTIGGAGAGMLTAAQSDWHAACYFCDAQMSSRRRHEPHKPTCFGEEMRRLLVGGAAAK